MSNLIDRDDVLELFQGNGWLLESIIRRCIEDLTVIDAVPVVRCGECIHSSRSPFGHPVLRWCPLRDSHRSPDWFCADGKRNGDASK